MREIPYKYRLDYKARIWWLRIRLFVLCKHLDFHHWKISKSWSTNIPDRVICSRCGVWQIQSKDRILRGWS